MIQNIIFLVHKATRKIFRMLKCRIDKIFTAMLFYANKVTFSNFNTSGIPFIHVEKGGQFCIGKNFKMYNGYSNPIGRVQRCSFSITKGAKLVIGGNVGMSSCAIGCRNSVKILKNVKIGGGTCIYDTDFHSIDPIVRKNGIDDISSATSAPVVLKENCFIGAHSTILKGVTVGENSVVGACSVVTKSIPDNEIWAGNPAKFIRKLE